MEEEGNHGLLRAAGIADGDYGLPGADATTGVARIRDKLFVTEPVRYLKRQVGFAAALVVQRKLAFEQTASLVVKTAGQRGHGLMQECAEIGRMLQRPADDAVSQVARRFAA
jgi:hypothetical protein